MCSSDLPTPTPTITLYIQVRDPSGAESKDISALSFTLTSNPVKPKETADTFLFREKMKADRTSQQDVLKLTFKVRVRFRVRIRK